MERSEYEILAKVESSHWWHGGMRANSVAMLDRLYGKRTDLSILDAGCGTGGNMRFLRRYGTVVGVDIAAESLEFRTISEGMTRGSVLQLPFASNSFDLVTSFDVLYHQNVPDEVVALREFHRVLGPNGRLFLRLPAYEFLRSKHDRAVHTRRRYTISRAKDMLNQAGFVLERHTYVNSLLFPIVLVQRLLERVLPSLEQQESDLSMPHPIINTLLRIPMALEAGWVSLACPFPYGLSILCLAHSGKTIVVPTTKRGSS